MSDFDGTDILQCRWFVGETSTINQYNECAGVCNGVPGANLIGANCTIAFTLTNPSTYAAALSANKPMTSVPFQFLFYGYPTPTGCSTPPAIIGSRPNEVISSRFTN